MKYSEIKEITRKLRDNSTPSERYLWKHLRKRSLLNARFNRQYPLFYDRKENNLRFFVADFYCHEHKLVIELDGKIHDYQKEQDQWREEIIKSQGLTVLRIKNDELDDIEKVINRIKQFLV
jgi:very-short-patch-repair endonuclease